ncbi:MAG: RNase adapter RapZ [Desulfobacteraceae bacterium]|nr:RNase adapter RapZ [Desulfobacteraceae bacterium]MBC2757079.1 RNase adapter RapZ [Desulfobacteraceae bacterium]MBC2763704.1 RNase adapter RapZ [ANME-2 cluster archaeon]
MTSYKIIIISGLSGSGKSTAIAALEDTGFYCVDNMPVELLPKFLELPMHSDTEIKGLAFVMDIREKGFLNSWPAVFEDLRQKDHHFEILFLEAEETVLLKRFSQTRRQHPLVRDKSLLEGIREEKKLLDPLKEAASRIIDTSNCNIHDLKSIIFNLAQSTVEALAMRIKIMSFGFKHGIPHDTDLIIDVRFLANPYFIPELKKYDGKNEKVKNYVLTNQTTHTFLLKFNDLLDFLIPLYEKEGKSYLTIAVGCTGGQHRSVVIGETIYNHINKPGRPVDINHRDIDIKI